MTTYCSLLNTECYPMQKYLTYYADKGMGFLLSAAGGGSNWTVKDQIRQAAAAMLLKKLYLTKYKYTMPKMNKTEQTATKNLAIKVLLHMKYKHHK